MNSTEEILQELEAMESPLARLSRQMPYAVPEGYFEDLAGRALQIAKWGSVPVGYFETLPEKMLAAAKESAEKAAPAPVKKPAKIIAFPALPWAAAAALIVSLAVGGGMLFNAEQPSGVALTELPDDELSAYAEANISDFETTASDGALTLNNHNADLTNLTPEELEAYLAENGWVE